MKRDWDVIREVLIEVEELSAGNSFVFEASASDPKDAVKAEHAFLLYKSGFLEGIAADYLDAGKALAAPKLTWAGHDLLATLRSKPVWERIKTVAQDKGIDLTVDAVKVIGKAALDYVIGS